MRDSHVFSIRVASIHDERYSALIVSSLCKPMVLDCGDAKTHAINAHVIPNWLRQIVYILTRGKSSFQGSDPVRTDQLHYADEQFFSATATNCPKPAILPKLLHVERWRDARSEERRFGEVVRSR